MYLQESNYNIGAEHNPKTFSHAISSKESDLWYNAMKDEIDSMASNRIWVSSSCLTVYKHMV